MIQPEMTFKAPDNRMAEKLDQLRAEQPGEPTSLGDRQVGLQPSESETGTREMPKSEMRVFQTQTERFLLAQAEQMQHRARAELKELDARLNEKDEKIHAVETKIAELQHQLAEKLLLLEARNIEVNDLKVAITGLTVKMAQLQGQTTVSKQPAEVEAQTASPKAARARNDWTLEKQAKLENRQGDYSLGEPNLTEAQKVRLTTLQEMSVTFDSEAEKKHQGSQGRRWHSNGSWKRRWKIWGKTPSEPS